MKTHKALSRAPFCFVPSTRASHSEQHVCDAGRWWWWRELACDEHHLASEDCHLLLRWHAAAPLPPARQDHRPSHKGAHGGAEAERRAPGCVLLDLSSSRHRLSGSELAEAHSHGRASLPDWASSVPFRRGGLLDDNVRVAGRAAPRSVRRDEDDDDGAVRKKPKKARSAATFYFLEHRAAHGGGVPFFQLKKLLMADYSKLSAEEQAKYVELAEGAFTALTRLCLCGCFLELTRYASVRITGDKERYRMEKVASMKSAPGKTKKRSSKPRRRVPLSELCDDDSEPEWSDGDEEDTEEEESEEDCDDDERENAAPLPQEPPAHRRLRRVADIAVNAADGHTAAVQAPPPPPQQHQEVPVAMPPPSTQPVDATPSFGRRAVASSRLQGSLPPASTVTSGGMTTVTVTGGGTRDTAAWGGGAPRLMAPPAPPRWRGGMNGSTRVITEPSPRVNPDATPGSTVVSAGVGATPHASRRRVGSSEQEQHAARRRRLV